MTWRLAHALDTLLAEILARWPDTTVWTLGDQDHAGRASDHNPTRTGIVCAIDVVDDGRGQADALWDFLTAQRDPRCKYAIHAGQIVSATVAPWRLRDYGGSNPHTDHVHVSVGRGDDGASRRPELYDDDSPWGLTTADQEGEQMLDKDDTGPAVTLLQQCLVNEAITARAAGVKRREPLPKYGVDGRYGGETAAAVKRYQKAAGLDPTGVAGGCTLALLLRYE